MILFMLWSHSWKDFCDLSTTYYEKFPVFFHQYTFGFVGLTGIALYLLRERLAPTQPLGRYCLKRGIRLLLVCLCIAIFLRVSFSHSEILLQFNSVSASLVSFLFAGRAFGFESVVARIAFFVILAGVLIRKTSLATFGTCLFALAILYLLRCYTYLSEAQSSLNLYNYMLYDIDTLLRVVFAGITGICVGMLIEHKNHIQLFIRKSFPYLCVLSVPFLVSYQYLSDQPWLAESISDVLRIVFAVCFGMLVVEKFPKSFSPLICSFGIYSLFIYIAHWELGFFVKQVLFKKNLLGASFFEEFLCASGCFVFLFLTMNVLIFFRVRNRSLDTALRKELGL